MNKTVAPPQAARLAQLLDRQDILDFLIRFSRGMDRFDRDIFLSAFHPDATIAAGEFVGAMSPIPRRTIFLSGAIVTTATGSPAAGTSIGSSGATAHGRSPCAPTPSNGPGSYRLSPYRSPTCRTSISTALRHVARKILPYRRPLTNRRKAHIPQN
jgi:hypothetical protein